MELNLIKNIPVTLQTFTTKTNHALQIQYELHKKPSIALSRQSEQTTLSSVGIGSNKPSPEQKMRITSPQPEHTPSRKISEDFNDSMLEEAKVLQLPSTKIIKRGIKNFPELNPDMRIF